MSKLFFFFNQRKGESSDWFPYIDLLPNDYSHVPSQFKDDGIIFYAQKNIRFQIHDFFNRKYTQN
jgi:hypothetical protein